MLTIFIDYLRTRKEKYIVVLKSILIVYQFTHEQELKDKVQVLKFGKLQIWVLS